MMIQYMVKSLNLQSSKPSNPGGPGGGDEEAHWGKDCVCGSRLETRENMSNNVMLLSCLHTKTISTLKQSPWFSSNPHLWDTWAWPPCFTQIPPSLLTLQLDFFF